MTFLEREDPRRVTSLSMRFADEVVLPDAVPTHVLTSFRPAPRRFVRFPGFKEEYYLHDLDPDPFALSRLGIVSQQVVGVVRPARDAASRRGTQAAQGEAVLLAFAKALVARSNVSLVLLARDRDQRERFLAEAPDLIAPEGQVDGMGLIAAADLFLGDTGIMVREAVALGTPTYTICDREPSPVDRLLLATGRLRRAEMPDDIAVRKKPASTLALEPRDPQIFVDELLALAASPRRANAGGPARRRRGIR
jgi:predicted glycosyltransferase